MSFKLFAGAVALVAAALPAAALADDPLDPKMQSAEALERDRQMIAALNRDMLAQVQARDAKYAAGWKAYQEAPRAQAEYRERLAAYERGMQEAAADRKRYAEAMAAWKRSVAACRAGDYRACE